LSAYANDYTYPVTHGGYLGWIYCALGLEASGGMVRVEPVDYSTLEEIKIFGEVLGKIAESVP